MNESEYQYKYYLVRVILSDKVVAYHFVGQHAVPSIIDSYIDGNGLSYTFILEPTRVTQSELEDLKGLTYRVTS